MSPDHTRASAPRGDQRTQDGLDPILEALDQRPHRLGTRAHAAAPSRGRAHVRDAMKAARGLDAGPPLRYPDCDAPAGADAGWTVLK